MNDIYFSIGWVIKGLELLVVFYLLYVFSYHRWSLFFGGKNSLKTEKDHELHSCFISAFCVLVFHFVGVELAKQVLLIDTEKLKLRQFFYFTNIASSASFACVLYFLHLIRGCKFSSVAINCLYITLIMMSLQIMQLIARGILDYDGLSVIYKAGVIMCNVTSLLVVTSYPVKQFMQLRKNSKGIVGK
ncbi:hypothetical protein [Pseudoalteromonas sp. S16_S37]|uniref:hypothetical protein n=1 Tax=Pseudoalteromonas sp. S16_S37 TaxID=2720228 RepID=UPI001681B96A|nr:hypothetical protein [Pseudoalteromonas sp. S16_S37]MBD1582774.1 hypothetical protein [Pseudoalteromonas sp. S16_S37]